MTRLCGTCIIVSIIQLYISLMTVHVTNELMHLRDTHLLPSQLQARNCNLTRVDKTTSHAEPVEIGAVISCFHSVQMFQIMLLNHMPNTGAQRSANELHSRH